MWPSMSHSPSSRKKPWQVTRRVCRCCRPTGGESGMAGPLFLSSGVGGLYGDGRHDAQLGDPGALALQNFEAESVECIGLADLGDAPGLVQHQPSDGDGDVLGQAPAELAVEVADRHVALADHAAVLAADHAALDGVVLVLDVAGDLLDDVF